MNIKDIWQLTKLLYPEGMVVTDDQSSTGNKAESQQTSSIHPLHRDDILYSIKDAKGNIYITTIIIDIFTSIISGINIILLSIY